MPLPSALLSVDEMVGENHGVVLLEAELREACEDLAALAQSLWPLVLTKTLRAAPELFTIAGDLLLGTTKGGV
jgi:hypothetical protein